MTTNTKVIEEASRWYSKLASKKLSLDDALMLEAWLDQGDENRKAWQLIESVNNKFNRVDPVIAKSTLGVASPKRRVVLKQLAVLACMGSLSWFMYRQQPWRGLTADHSTAVGEIHNMVLADGSKLFLNTDSAVNIVMTGQERLVELLEGEILIETGHLGLNNIPLRVKTQHGTITALGTRFNVRDYGEYTKVSLFEGKLQISASNVMSSNALLNAGDSLTFSAKQSASKARALTADAAWTNGFLVAYAMPLEQFIAELGRYHQGILHCDENTRHLRISGAFSIKDTKVTLRKLTEILPIKVETYTAYWSNITMRI